MNNHLTNLNKLYDKRGYFHRYSGSVFFTIVTVIIFYLVISYYLIQTRIKPIKANWTNERCSPTIIPFAGIINAPKGANKFKFTFDNFNYCINAIIKESAVIAVEPINAAMNVILDTFSKLTNAINDIRNIMSEIRNAVSDISSNIMSRIMNILIPIMKMVVVFKATMGKAHATMVTSMYTAISSMWFLISGLLNIHKSIIALLVTLVATIVMLWLIPFGIGIPAAIVSTTTFAAVAVPLGLLAGALGKIMRITGLKHKIKSTPKLHSCFDKTTLIRSIDNTLYSINSIPLGTILEYGGYVTAVLELDAKNENMYQLSNITVSGTHKVLHNSKWIYVKDHPDAVLIKMYEDELIYCLNTSKKFFTVGDYTFQDWDEIEKGCLNLLGCQKEEDIYKDLENGFHPETMVSIINKGELEIQNVNVGDILSTGERIRGVVYIKNRKPLFEYKNDLGKKFIATYQLSKIHNLAIIPSLSVINSEYLYHILTDEQYLHINGIKLMDYNWNIDYYYKKED